ncbi:crossover junction endodeoxyribonuclease RuvC [bacterium]|nr:crossover junction endodeoxyribonuclease RuvC [bacterium]
MIILGLDPGIARTGFGVIDTNTDALFLRCGCLTTGPEQASEDRLQEIGADLEHLIAATKPDRAIVETVLFGNNRKTAMLTAETRGMLLYILRKNKIAVSSLTPLQIKSRLTGYGQASKSQVQHVVTQRLKLTTIPEPDDAADALAAALCIADEPVASLLPA